MRFVIVTFFLLIIDLYVFRTIRTHSSDLNGYLKYSIYIAFWLLPIILVSAWLLYKLFPAYIDFRSSKLFLFMGAFFVLFTLPKIIIFGFQFIDDFSKAVAFLLKKLSTPNDLLFKNAEKISRSDFLTRLGLIISAIPFLASIYGIVVGRFNFNVVKKSLSFKNLPSSFDGFKIVQFSDLHIGSLNGHKDQVEKAINLINEQKPDVIFFTGDMVNNIATELDGWGETLSKLTAKHGVYSILGNHDYGEYFPWKNETDKQDNITSLINKEKELGFKLLLNDSSIIQQNQEQIAIVGVENWGNPPFPQYGDLQKALEKTKDIQFKLLLSHDPTHFDMQVAGKEDIALTFSGHTHGMQFAINFGGISWSPVKWKYKKWRGLYQHKNTEQYLYVNIGLGYIGFPGRVGTDPEITVMELKKA